MKLCPVCDQKIQSGTWCKNCKKFVKPYEIADGIRINESHNQANDADCEYHHSSQQYSSVFTKQETAHGTTASGSNAANRTATYSGGTAANRTATYSGSNAANRTATYSGGGAANRTASGSSTANRTMTYSGTNSSANRSGQQTPSSSKVGKVIVLIIILWFVGGLVVTLHGVFQELGAGFSDIFDALSSDGKKETNQKELSEVEKAGKDQAAWEELCKKLGYPELAAVFPEDYRSEGTSSAVYYLNPELLADQTDKRCTMEHMAKNQKDFELFFRVLDSSFEPGETNTDSQWNYFFVSENEGYTSFETAQEYYVGNSYVILHYDTVTKEIHSAYVYHADSDSFVADALPAYGFHTDRDSFVDEAYTYCNYVDSSLNLDREAFSALLEELSEKAKKDKDGRAFDEVVSGEVVDVYCTVYVNDSDTLVYCLEINARESAE